ncbi:PD-(D/E)XK nuclease family protein, partial [bacterium]|nr:PD-(D/E)XK nuclease family protein [bacterium]
ELIRDYVKRALLDEIVRSRIGERSSYYAVSRYPGFMSLLGTYLQDMRSLSDGGGETAMPPDLRSIAAAYELLLRRYGLTDHEGVIALVLEDDSIGRFCERFSGPFVADGFYDLTERQLEFFVRLFGQFGRCAVTLVHDPVRPGMFALPGRLLEQYERLGARIVTVESRPAGKPDCVLSGFMNGHYPEPATDGDVRIHTFRSEDAEADWICGTVRSLIHGGVCTPGDILIVSRAQPGFGSLLHIALKRHGIPVEGIIRRPMTSHPLVRFVLDALDASVSADNSLITQVRQSTYAGDMVFTRSTPVESADDRGWSCMIAETDTPEGFVSSLRRMLEQMRFRENMRRSLQDSQSWTDLMVYERLMGVLDEFEKLYAPFRKMMKAVEFNNLLRVFLETVTIPDCVSPGGGVLAAGINTARHIRRRVVFMAGLDNSSYPVRHDTFTLHGEQRARLLREHHELEEGILFYMACKGAERLYFTFPGIDDEGNDASMSIYLEDIRDGISAWSPPEFHHTVPGAAWQDGAVNLRGRAENIVRAIKKDTRTTARFLDSIMKQDEILGTRLRTAVRDSVDRAAGRDLILRENGTLDNVYREWGNERVFSVTALEDYLSCPVGFFLSRILGLEIELYEEDEVAPADTGTLIHGILTEFYTRRREKTGRTSFTRGEIGECRTLMKEVVERVTASDPVFRGRLHPVVFIAWRKNILAWMNMFLEKEAEYFETSKFEPSYFETVFGRPDRRSSTDYPPLALESGGERILIGGRIDRIDCESAAESRMVRVIDYKTGTGNASLGKLADGTSLQIPLYLKAAVELIVPGSIPFDGVFYTLREMEIKEYRENGEPLRGETWMPYIRTAVESACRAASAIRSGRFAAGSGTCEDYCGFRALCTAARMIKEKTTDADS